MILGEPQTEGTLRNNRPQMLIDTSVRRRTFATLFISALVLTLGVISSSCDRCRNASFQYSSDTEYTQIKSVILDSMYANQQSYGVDDSIRKSTKFHLSRTCLPSQSGDTLLAVLCEFVENEHMLSAITVHKVVRVHSSVWIAGRVGWVFFFTREGMRSDHVASAEGMEMYVRKELSNGFIDRETCKPSYDVIRSMPMQPYSNVE